ncbi:MAG: glycosyltransferase family 9 protein [Thermodesulfobacteriota bacterium]
MKTSSAPILIIHQGALGDLMLSLPALYSLRRHERKIPWTMAGNPEVLSLLQDRFDVGEILSLQGREWAALYQEHPLFPGPFRDFLNTFQKVILFSADNKDRLFLGLRRAGVKDILRIPSFPDVQDKIPLPIRQQVILESMGIPWAKGKVYLSPAPEDLTAATALLQSFQEPNSSSLFLAVHPGSGSVFKNWPWERFLETAKRLRDRLSLCPLFLFGPVEEDRSTFPFQPLQEAGFPLIRNLALPELAALLSCCRGYIGNDSGISHLAAALGLPLVAVFGPTDPLLWGPRGEKVTVLSPTLPCSPCSREKMTSCPQRKCLESIPVSRVVETVENLLTIS